MTNDARTIGDGPLSVVEALAVPAGKRADGPGSLARAPAEVSAAEINARRQAEEALRESEERYRDLFENANDVFYTLDLEGRITSINRRAEQLFGYSRTECLGRKATDLVVPEHHGRMQEALQRKLAGAAMPTVYELEVVCKDGRRVPLEVSSRLIVRNGQAVGVQGIARDISERRRAEQALRQSEERFRLALESGAITTFEQDAQLRYTWVYPQDPGFPEGNIGKSDAELVPGEEGQTLMDLKRRVLETGRRARAEVGVSLPGGVRHYDLIVEPRRDERGAIIGVCGAAYDITDRKRAEEALREADRRKDEFLAMLAHELRNPLAPIRNAVGVLKLVGSTDGQAGRARGMIERQVAHLARLVDDLLDVSRISRGKILLRKERADLVALVRAAIEDHRPLLENAGLTLLVELPDRPLWVLGDPTRLSQVVGNLLHNANKFTDAGGTVVVRLEAGPDDEGVAVLTVRDTGIGLEAAMLDRLFEPFSQADRSLDRSRGGLGLGLALVKGLVDLHGGRIQASSAGIGQGAEFVVRLPLDQTEPESLPPASPAAPSGQPLRVLVIEDNEDTAESMQWLLELGGHEVAVAHNGPAGLDLARVFRPDVVLCDIGLPGSMDGYAVARALRADPKLLGVRAIALSGYGQAEDQRKARQAGFDHHLTKPVSLEDLQRFLQAPEDGAPGRNGV